MPQELLSTPNMMNKTNFGEKIWLRAHFHIPNKLLDQMFMIKLERLSMMLLLMDVTLCHWIEKKMENMLRLVNQEMDMVKMDQLMIIIMLILVKAEEINGFMNSQEKMYHHLPLMPNLRPNVLRKTLEKEILMKKFMELPQLIPMFSQCQEEEDKLHMPTMDQAKNLTHLSKELIITIIIDQRKTLEKETSMKKYMELLLLIPTFSQCQEEEDKPHMPTMDQERNLTHWPKKRETRKILVKETSMKKFTVLLQLTLMSSQSQEEEDKLHMLTMDQVRKLIH